MPDYKRAVLIGNSEFKALPKLRCPGADVTALHELFRNKSLCLFDSVDALLDAPHNEIFTRINEVMRDAEKQDLVLIYYSGHGVLDSRGRLYLAAKNTEPSAFPVTAVSVSAIRECLSESRCQRFVLILDCCYAGAAADAFRNGPALSNNFSSDAADGVGEYVIAAATAIQRAEENQDDPLSLFTKHLIEGIRDGGADADGDGVIRLDELYDYVKRQVVDNGRQEPLRWVTGSASSFIIARSDNFQIDEVQKRLAKRLRSPAAQSLPPAIRSHLEKFVYKTAEECSAKSGATAWLAYAWARGEVTSDSLIDQWQRLSSDLAGVNRPAEVPLEKRWRTVYAARRAVLDLVGPTYLLDANFHFLDWNPAFDEVIAKPLRLLRGTHAENLILALENSREVIARAQRRFQENAGMPLVDFEILKVKTERFGLVCLRKIAAQISESTEHGLVWSVALNIDSAERDKLLWDDVERRLNTEVNWSRYAESYDKMLLHFSEYDKLLGQVVGLVGNSQHCADLGAGTGNSTLRLAQANPARLVAAFESNESMLQYLRAKIAGVPDAANRITVYKGDLTLSLREFPENQFDGATMVNVLYALDDPSRCLAEVFRVLQPESHLVLSTSHDKTDVDKLFRAIRADLLSQGKLAELRDAVEDAEDRHRQMMKSIHRDSRAKVIDYLTTAGFDITQRIDSAYADAVMIVQARKPAPKAKTLAERLPEKPSPVTPEASSPKESAMVAQASVLKNSKRELFISYSHRDREWVERVQDFLTPVIRTGRIKLWADTNLKSGDAWNAEIQCAINRARIAVLLVSPNFLASEFITNTEFPEIMKAAKGEGLKIVWLLLSAAPYDLSFIGPVIKEIQCAHPVNEPLDALTEARRNQVLTDIVRDLVALVDEV